MRVIAALVCLVAAEGLVIVADPAKSAKKEDAAPGPKFDNKAYAEDWHTEWKNGKLPTWKETYPKAALPYEDRQSDGKISLLTKPEAADAKDAAPGPKFDKKAYAKDWHTEWKNGELPSWKETYPKAALPYQDRQSDGKIGTFLQAEPKKEEEAAKKEGASKKEQGKKEGPAKMEYHKDFKEDWHHEWKNGDFPSWKETYPKAALPYEDRQSDGKIGNLLQADPKKKEAAAPGPKFDKKAYAEDWHKEWKNGELPSWKETYPKAALPYEDGQSDGKIGN